MTTALQDINKVVQENAPAQKFFLFGLDDSESPQPQLAKVIDGCLKVLIDGGGDASAANQETANTLLEGIQGQVAQSKTILSKTTLSVTSGAAVALPSVPVDAEGFLIDIESATANLTARLRYFLDGSTPTGTTGHQITSSKSIEERMSSIGNVKFITDSTTEANAVLTITYFKYAVNPVVITPVVPTANPIYTLSGTATVLPSYPAIKGFQAVGTATGAFTVDIPIECSNDNTNWTEVFYFQLGDTPNLDSDVRVWESNIKYWRIGTARNETGTGVAYSVTVAV